MFGWCGSWFSLAGDEARTGVMWAGCSGSYHCAPEPARRGCLKAVDWDPDSHCLSFPGSCAKPA